MRPDISEQQTAARVREAGLVAILRGNFSPQQLRTVADALMQRGVRVLEVTLGSAGALDGIASLRHHAAGQGEGRTLIGAGTVRTEDDVEQALKAGAQFLVSPNFDAGSIACSRQAGVLHLPGVATATEVQEALAAGCRMQKLFPASHFSPAYMKALHAPIPEVDFVPTGGIDTENAAAYLEAGAAALGVGSALVPGPGTSPANVAKRAERLNSLVRQVRRSIDG